MNMSWAAHSGQRKCIPKPAIPANKQCLAKLARNAPICACMRSADTSCAAELAGPPAAVHQGLAVVSLVQVHPPHVSVLAGCIHLQRVVACTGREAAGTGKHKPVPPRIIRLAALHWTDIAQHVKAPAQQPTAHLLARGCGLLAGRGRGRAAWWPHRAQVPQTAAAALPAPPPCCRVRAGSRR